MPGKLVRGSVQLEKRDISRIYSDVKKKPMRQEKKKNMFKKGKKGKK
jgi:hypothetical protein